MLRLKTAFCAVSLAFSTLVNASTPNPIDQVMSNTVGKYKLGNQAVNYTVAGELNYMYGFHHMDTGFHNSTLDFTSSNSIGYGIDGLFNTSVKDLYKLSDDDYHVAIGTHVNLAVDQHEIQVGYDSYVANTILGSNVKTNSDKHLSRNAIGQALYDHVPYAQYSVAVENFSVSGAVDLNGDFYLGGSVFDKGIDMKIHLWEQHSELNLFAQVGATILDGLKFNLGVGSVQDKKSFLIDSNYFLLDFWSVYASLTGNQDYSSLTIGTEYMFGVTTFYTEAVVESYDSNIVGVINKEGLVLGVKVVF